MITAHFRVGSLIRLFYYCDFSNRAVIFKRKIKSLVLHIYSTLFFSLGTSLLPLYNSYSSKRQSMVLV